MTTEFVVRLMDAADQVLAWCRMPVVGREDHAFWPTTAFAGYGEADGLATQAVIHWPELHTRTRIVLVDPIPIRAGETLVFRWGGPLMRMASDDAIPLPAVVVRGPVRVGVPTGSLSATGR